MAFEYIFLIVWIIGFIFISLLFFFTGKKSLLKFPEKKNSEFDFVEKGVSGYSTQSFKTKAGSARGVLQIKVTKEELWLTTNRFLAAIAEQFDLLHRIPIDKIKSFNIEGKNINLIFEINGRKKHIVIKSKRKGELSELIERKMRELKS